MSPFEKMFKGFRKYELAKTFVSENLDEPEELLNVVADLNGHLEAGFDSISEAYTNEAAVKDFYLFFLPEVLPVYATDAFAVHELILDLYHYLFKKDYLNQKQYHEMLAFFQENKEMYLKKAMNEDYWSDEKSEHIDQLMNELMSDEDVPPELKKMFEVLNEMADSIPEERQNRRQNKVIQFPGNQIEVPKGSVFRLRIDLKGFKPPIWRRVLIPSDYNFSQLHQVIQALFEWENYHLYSFETPDLRIEPAGESDFDMFDWGPEPENPDEILISEVLPVYNTMSYTYDFGDDWEHKIKLEQVLTPVELAQDFKEYSLKDLPICVKGKGDAPMEDSRSAEDDEAFVPFDMNEINQRLSDL